MKTLISRMLGTQVVPESQVKPPVPVIFDASGFFKKAPEKWSRKERLAYVESVYSTQGLSGDKDKFIREVRFSAGLSRASFEASREYGLHVHYRRGGSGD